MKTEGDCRVRLKNILQVLMRNASKKCKAKKILPISPSITTAVKLALQPKAEEDRCGAKGAEHTDPKVVEGCPGALTAARQVVKLGRL